MENWTELCVVRRVIRGDDGYGGSFLVLLDFVFIDRQQRQGGFEQ